MDKFLPKLIDNIKKKNYSKILYLFSDLKKNTEPMDKKTIKSISDQKEILKLIILNDIQMQIKAKKELIPDMIALIKYLDINFQEQIEKIVINYLIFTYQNMFNEKIIIINSVDEIVKFIQWYEKYVKDLELKYSFMPDYWCVIDVITLLFCGIVDKYLSNLIDSLKNNISKAIEVINIIVKFELNNTRQIICRKNCTQKSNTSNKKTENPLVFADTSAEKTVLENSINLEKPFGEEIIVDEIECCCGNKKILSKRLEMFYENYVDYLCEKLSGIFYNKKETEMQIITCFVHFLNELSRLYYRILYFENEKMFLKFISKCDDQLCHYISQIELINDFKEGIVIANTLLFIEQTMNEFISKFNYLIIEKEKNLNSFTKLRELEKKQLSLLDKEIEKKLKKLSLCLLKSFSVEFIDFLEKEIFLNYFNEITKELSDFVLTSINSTLLLLISKYKLNVERSEHILSEILEIKNFILLKVKKIPFFDVLESFLKIFLVPTDDIENFISNFLFVSNNRFDFSQILKKVYDKKNNAKLYIEYKKQKNELN
ncbi:hypothetical protein TUBRATIS_006360 [Tubulinosema ratisbonensis]|uniref:Exocyst complex component Sec6 n=1 Tax=Tubulinosema ratisbonensis TaxID=291195 RepID=A0A437APA8_9MICR|nr:hypothetical protein TUBRATIS_006360 [Tubulinosema ratisbonensis]